jgi:septum formation protein
MPDSVNSRAPLNGSPHFRQRPPPACPAVSSQNANGWPLILASASPRRRVLLERLGIPFTTAAPEVAEINEGTPRANVALNARAKHDWCRARRADAAVLAADTVVALEGAMLPKPASLDEARAFFRRLSGRSHEVLTAVAYSRPGQPARLETVVSSVRFRALSEADIDAYFERVDPLDKAGGYDIDQHGDRVVAAYTGSYTNIMGLPMEVVTSWLR